MRILVCWPELTGYVAACWRALAALPGVTLRVVTAQPGAITPAGRTDPTIVAGLDWQPVALTRGASGAVAAVVGQFRPDAIIFSGWFLRPFVDAAVDYRRRHPAVRLVLALDTQLRLGWRRAALRWRRGPLLRRMDAVLVPGERGALFARDLGVATGRIHRGVVGVDDESLARAAERRAGAPQWPRRFVFVGRYSAEKNLAALVAGYTRYRGGSAHPWDLTCCGRGPLAALLRGVPGVTDLGFVEPPALPGVLAEQGVLVLPSRYEPWGQALVEGAAAGLPLLCTSECGAAEIVRPYWNGILLGRGEVEAIAAALQWFERHEEGCPQMGRRARVLGEAYGAAVTAQRWFAAANGALPRRNGE